jgi:hypothetical protein
MQRQREQRRKQTRMALWIGIGVALVAVVGVLAAKSYFEHPVGRTVAIMGNQHITHGEQHVAYSSKPATSGPHWNEAGAPVAWGVYKEPQQDEQLVHNLEHGGVGIHYNCRDCPDLVSAIEDFYTSYTTEPSHRLPLYPSSTKLVVAPYYDMPTPIAITAWGRIDTMDNWDADRVTKFIEAYRDKGPEKTP